MSAETNTPRFTFPGLAHALVAEVAGEGSFVVDATAGRGRDAVALARLVGPTGSVLAVDVQADAVRSTDELLRAESLRERVELVRADHAALDELLGARRPDAVLFNLGWLPGGSHAVVTSPASTLPALDAALAALAPTGRLVVVAYRGHPEGRGESAAVLRWARALRGWRVGVHRGPHREGTRVAPRVLAVQRCDGARGARPE